VPPEKAYRPPYIDQAMASARSALGGHEFEFERAAGAARSIDDAVGVALSID
jgi:hypothetical protein